MSTAPFRTRETLPDSAGERTQIERDPCGRIVRREYDDGTADTFAYDPAGRLTRADNGAVCCTWSYDARGNLVRETQSHEARTVTVEHTYNAANQRTGTRTNAGYSIQVERDAMGQAAHLVLAGGATMGSARWWSGTSRAHARRQARPSGWEPAPRRVR